MIYKCDCGSQAKLKYRKYHRVGESHLIYIECDSCKKKTADWFTEYWAQNNWKVINHDTNNDKQAA